MHAAGDVVNVDVIANTISVSTKGETPKLFKVKPGADIRLNNSGAKLTDLSEGMTAKVISGEPGYATRIEASGEKSGRVSNAQAGEMASSAKLRCSAWMRWPIGVKFLRAAPAAQCACPRARAAKRLISDSPQHRVQLVLELEPALLHFFRVLVGQRLYVRACAMRLTLDPVVLVEQLTKVRVLGLERVDAVLVLGKLVGEVVLLVVHVST